MALCLCLCLFSLASCGAPPPPPAEPDVVPIEPFDDHTIDSLLDVGHYMELSGEGIGRRALKFIVVDFQAAATRELGFLDANFYTFHDEWFWFTLLNGVQIPDVDTEAVAGQRFETIEEVYGWAREVGPSRLPLDLRWVRDGDRLYSPSFYSLALGEGRPFGAGTLVFVEARQGVEARPERWVFELEYSDALTHGELVVFFEELEASLPPEIASELLWVVRSPAQESLAVEMEREALAYHDRILRYSELAVPGEVEVYSEGITAGRVLVARTAQGDGLASSTQTSVLLTDVVPDYLPAAAGLITSVPQTPLAHVNVLARNRGIPNLYIGGVLEDPSIDQLKRIRAHVVLRAQKPDIFEMVAITSGQYSTWRGLETKEEISVPAVDMGTLSYLFDLAEVDAEEVDSFRLAVGGKAAGVVALMAPGTVTIPESPAVISVRAYHEHFSALRPLAEAALSDSEFKRSPRLRLMALEGVEAYDARFFSEADESYKVVQGRIHLGTPIGEMIEAGGLKKMLRDRRVEPSTMARIQAGLAAQFRDHSALQGLRFRSSSTVEDIEGFNGAGLYDSNTGFLDPELQPAVSDHKKSVEWALKKTWASYWGFEAFEERALERVNHLSGEMAVLVHARFDDEMEMSNGVFTVTLMPEGSEEAAVMELNVQLLDESVTNPVPGAGALPEVVRVSMSGGVARVERVSGSNRVGPGVDILSDEKVLGIFAQAMDVTLAWRGRENAALRAAQRAEILTLDFEFREMAPGWPALVGERGALPQRIIIKQARSLEPSLRGFSVSLREQDFPGDVLRRARRIERWSCASDAFDITLSEVFTDPLLTPDLGHETRPFTAFFSVAFKGELSELGEVSVDHTEMVNAGHPGMVDEATWAFEAALGQDAAQRFGLEALRLFDGAYRVDHGSKVTEGALDGCTQEVLHASPDEYLSSLLGQ